MIQDKAIEPTANIRLQPITCAFVTAISQTSTKALGIIPGYAFEVEKVEVWASGVTATITADVKIGTTSVLTGAVTPVAGTATAGTLTTSRATRRGTRTSQLNFEYTTNGTGVGTNMKVTAWVRAYPLNGEA